MADKTRGKVKKQNSADNLDEIDEMYSSQKARRAALANMSKDAGYEVQGKGYDVRRRTDKKAAYDELESLQRSAIADYQRWAEESVRYDALGSENAAKNLKQYNDTYTMSMLMGVISPLENGCSISSVMQCLMSYNIVRTLNPDMDMDSSRMFYNFKNTVAPMIADMQIDHPIAGRLFSGAFSSINSTLSEAGGAKFASTIDSHEKMHDVDSMYLTPRQVAALKLNFMEQYYSDLRSTKSEDERQTYTSQYNTAMEHLNAICNNGGYDMSVVAEEERYLVSLKIQQNPNYMTMFSETFDVFGAKVDVDSVNDSQRWMGKFISTDEHAWYGHKDLATNGAFHVRQPMSYDGAIADMKSHAESFNAMRQYVNSELFTGTRDDRAKLLDQIDEHEDQYLTRMEFISKTDNIKMKPDVETLYEKQQDIVESESASKINAYGVDPIYISEMDSVMLSKVVRKLGYDPDDMRDNERRVFDTESDAYKKMLKSVDNYVRREGSDISAEQALENMQINYFNDMNAEEQYDVLAHVITNVQQGYSEHHSDRSNVRTDGISRIRDIRKDFDYDMTDSDDSEFTM